MTPKKISTGERIKQRRHAVGLSQRGLAGLVQVSMGAISNIERGITANPSSANLEPIAKALRVDPQWLITGEEAKDKPYERELSQAEKDTLHKYNNLNIKQQAAIHVMMDALGDKS